MQLHYGTKYDDKAYNHILVQSCAEHGIAAFTGDGLDPEVFASASAAIGAQPAAKEFPPSSPGAEIWYFKKSTRQRPPALLF